MTNYRAAVVTVMLNMFLSTKQRIYGKSWRTQKEQLHLLKMTAKSFGCNHMTSFNEIAFCLFSFLLYLLFTKAISGDVCLDL